MIEDTMPLARGQFRQIPDEYDAFRGGDSVEIGIQRPDGEWEIDFGDGTGAESEAELLKWKITDAPWWSEKKVGQS